MKHPHTTTVAWACTILAAGVLGLLSLVPESLAQWGGAGSGPGGRIYDPGTVETISGEVVSVDRVAATKRGKGVGVHLTLKTDRETVAVHLGPAWYVDGQETKIAAGDQVTVTGSRVTVEDQPALIAAEVRTGEATLALRDTNGVPLWSRARRGGRGRTPPTP